MSAFFLRALDVLHFRGNQSFGDPGSYGQTQRLPWPSVASGALRSALLVRKDLRPAPRDGWTEPDPELGTPDRPSRFTLRGWTPAWRKGTHLERLLALPADLVVQRHGQELVVGKLRPVSLHPKLATSTPLPRVAVLAETRRIKPESGYWLDETGWAAYVRGEPIPPQHLVSDEALWRLDERVGIGLDERRRAAADGKLFSLQALAPRHDGREVGYLAETEGAAFPERLSLRLGGDGRAAIAEAVSVDPLPQPDVHQMQQARRCRLVLTTPGLFPHGWLPTGADPAERRNDGAVRFALHGLQGWIVAAALPRGQVVSGWDLARWRPKTALRSVPMGSVWWLELDEGIPPESYAKLVAQGLWDETQYDGDPRRAEGYNRIAFALWND